MSKTVLFLSSLAVVLFALGLSGCPGTEDAGPIQTDQPQVDAHADHDHDAEAAEAETKDDAQKEKMLADLSPEDKAAVEKQRICPVSEGLLWSMDKPYKLTVTTSQGQEREVFLCCQGCEGTIKDDPDTYLAKLDQ